MIVILPYQERWPGEFLAIGKPIRACLGDLAVRIDHIGSTSVPQLAAKDIIDVQITVRELKPEIEASMIRMGYRRIENKSDHVPPGKSQDERQWEKWLFKQAEEQRPANIHVRIDGRANQLYPLLFRDYLRAQPMAAQAYGRVKETLARLHPEDVDAYYEVKDPACDIILAGAELWASMINWKLGESDC